MFRIPNRAVVPNPWAVDRYQSVFSDESRFCLGASDSRVLLRRRPGERVKSNCHWPRHTGPTPGVIVKEAISYNSGCILVVVPNTLIVNLFVSLVIQPIILPFMNSIQGGVFQQHNARPHTTVETQHALQSVACYLGQRDHQICIQLSTFGISLYNSSVIQSQY
ncbi:HTH_Tnp_Tc3_2 domain-containing protein [Trichonephila clavipes]|nr:HTH_Tnp_Tc3_2 domain-containing protein [Trichonephila clavipes]